MLDYNTMTYQEGRALLKQADIDPAAIWKGVSEWGKGALNTAGQHIGNAATAAAGSGAADWAKKNLWDNKLVRDMLLGTGGGALAGGLSSLFQDEEERSPVSRTLTGAILGGIGGAGYGMYETSGQDNSAEHIAEKLRGEKNQQRAESAKYYAGGPVPKPKGADDKPVVPEATVEEMAEDVVGPDGKLQSTGVGMPDTERKRIRRAWSATGNNNQPTGKTDWVKGLANTGYEASGLAGAVQNAQDVVEGQPLHGQDVAVTGAQVATPFALHGLSKLENSPGKWRSRVGRGAGRILYGKGEQVADPNHMARLTEMTNQNDKHPGLWSNKQITDQQNLANKVKWMRTPGKARTAAGIAGSMVLAPATGKILDLLTDRESAMAAAEQRQRFADSQLGRD
jgi:hypothetical protein